MLKIETGLETRALKVVIYGAEGIGKSTFASQFPNPLFLDTEGGTSSLNIRRVKCGQDWSYLLSCVEEVIKDPSICKTLVIDTADWAESLCTKFVCEKYRKSNIEEFGFGKGYVYLQDEFSKLLAMDSFDETIFKEQIQRIDAYNGNRLVFHFKNGTTKEVIWDAPSRSDSWTEEMKLKAKERSLNYGKR